MSRKFFRNDKGINLGNLAADPTDGIAGSFYYSTSTGKIRIFNGTIWKNVGSGTGFGDVDTMAIDTAEEAVLTDYVQTGLEIVAQTGLIHNDVAFRLVHQSASTRSFKKTLAVDSKFRGKTMTYTVDMRSTALSADLTLLVRDETNSADLLSTTQIQTDSTAVSVTTTSGQQTLAAMLPSDYNTVRVGMSVTGPGIPTGTTILSKNDSTRVVTMSLAATASATISARFSSLVTKRTFSFPVPDNCLSISWTISALAEANAAESYFDDINLYIAKTPQQSTSITTTIPNTTPWATGPAPSGTITNASIQTYRWRQAGQNIEVQANIRWSGAGSLGGIAMAALLPSGYTVDTSNLTPSILGTPSYVSIGRAYSLDASTADYSTNILLNVTAGTILVSNQTNVPVFTPGNLDEISINITVPVVGFTASTTTTQTIPLTSAILSTNSDSLLRLAYSGQGSTNTRIATFSGPVNDQRGSDFTWISSPTLGDYFQCNREGLYTFMVNLDQNNPGAFGLSVDSVNLTTDFTSLPNSETVAFSAYGSTGADVASVTTPAYVKVGQKIRLHCNTGFNANAGSYSGIIIMGQQSTKLLNPSSDQKIEIPSSELRFGGATGRGSTDTGVVRFPNVDNMSGDAFSVVNTAANGTVVTMLKDGKLSTNVACYTTTSGVEMDITRNMTSPLTSTPLTAGEILATAYVVAAQVGGPSWTGLVKKGDVFRITTSANITANATSNFWNLSFQEMKVQVALSNVSPTFVDNDANLELNTYNGVGSTYNKMVRFANIAVPDGSGKLTYTDSATDGASIRVNEDGIYFITASVTSNTTAYGIVGLTRNEVLATTGTTAASGTTTAQGRIALSYAPPVSGQNSMPQTSYFGKCSKGDVIRVKLESSGSGDVNGCYLNMVKIGKPSLTAVDVTPFLNLKTQDYDQFEATYNTGGGFGSTNTGVPIYTARAFSNRGIFQHLVSSTAGSSFVILRDCRVTMSASGSGNNTGLPGLYLTKNEVNLTTAGPIAIANIMGYQTAQVNNYTVNVTANIDCKAGDILRVQRDSTNLNATPNLSIIAVADTTSIVSAAKTYRMSDYLGSGTRVSGVDPANLGEYRTFYRAASASAIIDCTSIATAPSTTNGMFIDGGKAWTQAGSVSVPQVYRVFIGKNKSWKVDWYASTGRTGLLSPDYFVYGSGTTNESGALLRYDPTTGVLEVDAAYLFSAVTNTRYLGTQAGGNLTATGYFDITVFDSPFVSQPLPVPVNASMFFTTGGTYAAGSTNTVLYNVVEYDTHNGYNPATGLYTCKVAGKYRIASTHVVGGANTEQVHQVNKNGAFYKELGDRGSTNGGMVTSGSCIVKLAVGDTMNIVISYSGAGGAVTNQTTQGLSFWDLQKID